MKVNSISQKIYKSRILKKGLEFAAENSPLFIAGTSLAFTLIRPLAVILTPNIDRENKILPLTKSISSAAISFIITLGLSLPLAKGIKKIDKYPLKYLKQETIEALRENGQKLSASKSYQLATQIFKLGLGFVIAAPKEILTNKLIPSVIKLFFKDSTSLQKADNNRSDSLNFEGSKDFIPKNIGKILDKKQMQDFVINHKDSNLRMHLIALSDAFATSVFVGLVNKNREIKENKRKILVNNALISTSLCIGMGYALDKALNRPAQKFINKFCAINKGDKNLAKYLEGIKIVKPTLIFGIIYYGIVPVISAFCADRIEKKKSFVNIS